MNEIPLIQELEKFSTHLKDNPRTILSSAFGNGKTTFLKQFMDVYGDRGEFIVVHPVNYSCGTNEDVFEYIKRDILMQLDKKDLLSKIDWNAIDATLFSWESFKDVIGFLLSLAPGGSHLSNIWKRMQPLIDKVKEKKDEYDECKKTFDKYEDFFTNQRGGIYEHDAYTILIEKALETIHNRRPSTGMDYAKNNTTLIIEDMDRIDPAHLFRILNVLGAHIDEENNTNKFGFKNIVLVIDYETTEHIFHHFYGENANYQGYINKFIKHTIYNFDITEAARNELINTLASRCLIEKEELLSIPICGNIVQSQTLGNVIESLCVRDISNILDDLDNQIVQGFFDCKGQTIDSIAPITVLFAALVRLNRTINYEQIFQHISITPLCLSLLQQYMLYESIFSSGAPFMIGLTTFQIRSERNTDGTSSVIIERYIGDYAGAKDERNCIYRCFCFARSKVKGCL